jgi:hypothetical protein
VADRLEDDERCARLEKLDRLEVFQVCFECAHLFIFVFRDVKEDLLSSRLQ